MFAQLAQASAPATPADLGISPLVMIIGTLLGIGLLICWIMEIIAAFKKEEKPLMGIISLVGGLLCTPLVPLIIGWINAKKWGIQKLMLIWTILLVIYAVLYGSQFGKIMSAMQEAQPAP